MARNRGIIFDMDNTLLQSRIHFEGMKQAIYHLLAEHQVLEPDLVWRNFTASQLIELGRRSGKMTPETEQRVWDTVTAFEKEGMRGAVLEEHVPEVLAELHQRFRLFVLTNNACAAAKQALRETGIAHFFDSIVGREQMTALKPSSSGVTYILNLAPDLPTSHWSMVGDSWIDGKAAQDASVRFIAYKANRQDMERHQVVPTAYISSIRELLEHDWNG